MMSIQLRKSFHVFLQARLFRNGIQFVKERCLARNIYKLAAYSDSISNHQLANRYLCFTSCICQVHSANNLLQIRHISKKSVPLDPVCHEPIWHPGKGDLIYVGHEYDHFKGVKVCTFFVSALFLIMQPMVFEMLFGQHSSDVIIASYALIISFIIVGMPIILHRLIIRKYVGTLYYNKENGIFTAKVQSFFMRPENIQFTAADVVIPSSGGIFTHMKVKGRPLFVHPPAFRNKQAYNHMMGYDQPISVVHKQQQRLDEK